MMLTTGRTEALVEVPWNAQPGVVAAATAMQQARDAEAKARAAVGAQWRATGDPRSGAGNHDGFDALAAAEARAALPAAERDLALAEAARMKAERTYAEAAEAARTQVQALRAEERRWRVRRFYDEPGPVTARAVQDFDEETAQLTGLRDAGCFWPEFARATSREPSKWDERRARDQQEGWL